MALFDVLLISVIVITGYPCLTLVWRLRRGQRTFGVMIVLALVLAVISLLSRRSMGPNALGDVLGVISIGGALCLIIVPPILRDLAQRALLKDRPKLARVLVDARSLLQPGMGGERDRELIDTMVSVRNGDEDQIIDRLIEVRGEADDSRARRRIDERVVMTYLYARRYADAVDYYDDNIDTTMPIPLNLEVEMVRALCEVGDFERAADSVERIEHIGEGPMAGDPALEQLVGRARLVFLVYVGRTTAVERILATANGHGMPANARAYWSGLARLHAGDRTGARTSLARAAKLSRGAQRERTLATLATLDDDAGAPARAVPPRAAELADKIAANSADAKAAPSRARAPRLRLSGVALSEVPVTVGLLAANLAVAVLMYIIFGSGGDIGGLVRAGATLPSAVEAGEYWRLSTYMFLHVGALHLFVNMYGLWVLGRLVEQMQGSRAFFATYVLAGLGGGVASVLFGGAAAAGASGAVMGILGAAIAEFTVHKKSYPQRWTGSLTGLLLFLVAANVIIGFVYPVIDQSAHVGGLVSGALIAIVLSPHGRLGAGARRALAGGLSVVCAAAIAYGAVFAVSTSFADTLARFGVRTYEVSDVEVELPGDFEAAGGIWLVDRSQMLRFGLTRARADMPLEDAVVVFMSQTRARSETVDGFETTAVATTKRAPVPAPWISRELILSADAIGVTQRYRVIVFGRRAGDEIWLGNLYVPEHLSSGVSDALDRALTSAKLSAGAAPAPVAVPPSQ